MCVGERTQLHMKQQSKIHHNSSPRQKEKGSEIWTSGGGSEPIEIGGRGPLQKDRLVIIMAQRELGK